MMTEMLKAGCDYNDNPMPDSEYVKLVLIFDMNMSHEIN